MSRAGEVANHKVEIHRVTFWFGAFIIALVLLMGAANLWASWQFNKNAQEANAKTQQKQEELANRELQRLCHDVGTMAAIPPPAGSAAANPSRAYEQAEHRAWMGLQNDIGCPAGST